MVKTCSATSGETAHPFLPFQGLGNSGLQDVGAIAHTAAPLPPASTRKDILVQLWWRIRCRLPKDPGLLSTGCECASYEEHVPRHCGSFVSTQMQP